MYERLGLDAIFYFKYEVLLKYPGLTSISDNFVLHIDLNLLVNDLGPDGC